MLEAIGAAPGSVSEIDWHQVWRQSPEYRGVQTELAWLRSEEGLPQPSGEQGSSEMQQEFAASFLQQFALVTKRVLEQSWRTPSYIYSKLGLVITANLFIGLVFLNAPLTIRGLQNQMFAIFELMSIVGQLADQQMPSFVAQRAMYEVRERPAKTYSWSVFMLSQIVADLPWATVSSVFAWVLIYYPVGFYKNADAAGQGTERGVLMWLLFWQLMIWISTFSHLCISFVDTTEMGGNLANFLFVFVFFFCGVMAPPSQLPSVWHFIYRASPLSYFVSAVLSTGIANVDVTCASNEYTVIDPPAGQTCGEYMAEHIAAAGGYLLDAEATSNCSYCKIKDTNVFLSAVGAEYEHRWRNFGIVWVHIIFNIVAAIGLYWLVRMPKGTRRA